MRHIRRWAAGLTLATVFALALPVVMGSGTPPALAAVTVTTNVATPAVTTSVVTPANPDISPCSVIPGGLGSLLCNPLVTKYLGKAIAAGVKKAIASSPVGSAAGAAAGAAASAVGNSFLEGANVAVQAGAKDVLSGIGGLIGKIQTPNLQVAWFFKIYGDMLGLMLVLLGIMYLVGLVMALVRLSAMDALKTTAYAILAIVASFLIPAFLQIMVILADKLASSIAGTQAGSGADFSTVLSNLITQMTGANVSVWLSLSVSVAAFAVAFLLYMELVLRTVVAYTGLLFAPLTFASMTLGEWGKRLTVRLLVLLMALIFSLPVVVAILTLGTTALANITNLPGAGFGKPLLGGMFLGIALLSPWPLVAWTQHVVATMRGSIKARNDAAATQAVAATGTPTQAMAGELGRNWQPARAAAIEAPQSEEVDGIRGKAGKLASVPGIAIAAGAVFGPEAAVGVQAVAAKYGNGRGNGSGQASTTSTLARMTSMRNKT
jgi:hypothetical protein